MIGLPQTVTKGKQIKADDINNIVGYIRANNFDNSQRTYDDTTPDSVSQGMVKDVFVVDGVYNLVVEQINVLNKSTGRKKSWDATINELPMDKAPLIIPTGSTDGAVLLELNYDGYGWLTTAPVVEIYDEADLDESELSKVIASESGTIKIRLFNYTIEAPSSDTETDGLKIEQVYCGSIELEVMELPAGFPIVYNSGTDASPAWQASMTITNSFDMETGLTFEVTNPYTDIEVAEDDDIYLTHTVDLSGNTSDLIYEVLSSPETTPWVDDGEEGIYYYHYATIKAATDGLYPDVLRTGGVTFVKPAADTINHPWKVTKTGENTINVKGGTLSSQGAFVGLGGVVTIPDENALGALVDSTTYIYLKIYRDSVTRELGTGHEILAESTQQESTELYQYVLLAVVTLDTVITYILQVRFEDIDIFEALAVINGEFRYVPLEMAGSNYYILP